MLERRKVRTDLILTFGSQFIFKVLGYVVLALLARHLPREALGEFLYAGAVAGVLVLFTELGTSDDLTRATARESDRAAAFYTSVLRSRLPLVVVYLVVTTAFIAVTRPSLVWVGLAVAVYIGLKDLYRSSSALLYGLKRVRTAQLAYGAGMLLLATLVVVLVRDGATLREVLTAYVVWSAALFVGGFAIVRRSLGPLPWRRGRDGIGRVIRRSLPLFAVQVLALIHLKVDTVMVGTLRPMHDVATYEAGAKLLEASQFLVRPMSLVFFPIMSELVHAGDLTRLESILPRILGGSFVLGVGLTTGVAIFAPWIIPAVFGSGFADSVPVLRVLYLSVPTLYLTVVATFAGNALHIERTTIAVLLAGVALNLALNAAVIPRFGPVGAAWCTVASQTALAVGLVSVVRRDVKRNRKRKASPRVEAGSP